MTEKKPEAGEGKKEAETKEAQHPKNAVSPEKKAPKKELTPEEKEKQKKEAKEKKRGKKREIKKQKINELSNYLLGIQKDVDPVTQIENKFLGVDDLNFGDYVLVFPNPDSASAPSFKEVKELQQMYLEGMRFDLPEPFEKYQKRLNEAFKGAIKSLAEDTKYTMAEQKAKIDNPLLVRRQWDKPGLISKDERTNSIKTLPQKSEGAKDALTIFRNLILMKLSMEAGFKVRSFVSNDFMKIYSVLYAKEANLIRAAEQLQIDKELKFEKVDLFSLEPVDERRRPLRLHSMLEPFIEKKKVKKNENVQDPEKEKEQERIEREQIMSKQDKVTKDPVLKKKLAEIGELLKRLNFKRMVYKLGIMHYTQKSESVAEESNVPINM